MTYKLDILTDVHTSDLINSCQRSVMHRHLGEEERLMQRALFSGLVAHSALEEIHLGNWSVSDMTNIVDRGVEETLAKGVKEKRPPSDAVIKDMDEIKGDVQKHLIHYVERFGDYFTKCKVIGVELPVRWSHKPDDQPIINFASHIDMLYRDPFDELRLMDWKLQESDAVSEIDVFATTPDGLQMCESYKTNHHGFTMEFLARNLQMPVYHFVIAEGAVKIHDGDEGWVEFGEYPWMEILDLKNCKLYSRKGERWCSVANGKVQYVKGDQKPKDDLLRSWRFAPSKEEAMKTELASRVWAMRNGYWPTNPDKRGCQLCQSKRFCTNFIHEHEPT